MCSVHTTWCGKFLLGNSSAYIADSQQAAMDEAMVIGTQADQIGRVVVAAASVDMVNIGVLKTAQDTRTGSKKVGIADQIGPARTGRALCFPWSIIRRPTVCAQSRCQALLIPLARVILAIERALRGSPALLATMLADACPGQTHLKFLATVLANKCHARSGIVPRLVERTYTTAKVPTISDHCGGLDVKLGAAIEADTRDAVARWRCAPHAVVGARATAKLCPPAFDFKGFDVKLYPTLKARARDKARGCARLRLHQRPPNDVGATSRAAPSAPALSIIPHGGTQ